jgi:hypothetical protein
MVFVVIVTARTTITSINRLLVIVHLPLLEEKLVAFASRHASFRRYRRRRRHFVARKALIIVKRNWIKKAS